MRKAASWMLLSILALTGAAHADPATLTRVSVGSGNGEANAFQIASGNWDYDPGTQTLSLTGNQQALFRVGTTPLYTASQTGTVINLNAETITASAFECIEGIFGGIVGANICGNYNFGTDGINDSTLDYSSIPGTRTLGGDDTAIGPQQQLTDQPTVLGDCTGTTLIVNSSDWTGATPSDGSADNGVQYEFTVASCVAAPAQIDVPDVVGQAQATAEGNITGGGLTVGAVTQQADAVVPAGNVISQNPAACTTCADAGDPVDLVVSTGPAAVLVPDVVGQVQATAEGNITGAGLAVGNVTQAADAVVPAGSVISQNPASGASVAPGSAVDLVVSTGPANTSVPDVVGQTQADATTAITGAGLVVGTVTMQADAVVPAGNVISQNPAAAAMVAPGAAVNLVVSSGPASISVPDVTGQTQADATTAITGAGLVVGTVTQQADAVVPAGNVISQNPAAASMVAGGSPVDLVVSSGPPAVGPTMLDLVRVTVGSSNGSADLDLTGSTATWQYDAPAGDLTGTLTSAGFYTGAARVGTTPLYTTEINDLVVAAGVASATDYSCTEGIFGGIVGANICGNYNFGTDGIDDSTATWGPGTTFTRTIGGDDMALGDQQNIAGYNLVPISWDGTTLVLETTDWTAAPETTGLQMELTVAAMTQVDVPDVTGQAQADAEAAIVAAGLVVGTVTPQVDAMVPAGNVISQNPVACTMCADAGSAVDLVVSSGAALVDVPDVVGQTEADAGTAITGAGLVVGTVTQSANDTVPAGSVISQNPAACTACVAGGSAVDLEVSTGPAIPPGAIDVPDVTGQTQSQATQALAAAGLTVGIVNSVVSNDVPAGVVVDQSPAGCEACAAPGSAVNLDVSSGPDSLPGGGTAMSPWGLGALLLVGWLRRRIGR